MSISSRLLGTTMALATITTFASAQVKEFVIGGPNTSPAAQTFTFESDADFENFTGISHKIGGWVKFDAAKKTGSAKLILNLASVETGIALRDEHMRSPNWLDTTKYPEAVFETTSVKFVKGDEYTVTGKLTFHGVTKTITAPATVKYSPENAATKKARYKGDVVRVRTTFNLKLADYGVVVPDALDGKVASTVKVTVDAFGQTG